MAGEGVLFMGSGIVARGSRSGRTPDQRCASVPPMSAAVTDPFDFLRLLEPLTGTWSGVGQGDDPTARVSVEQVHLRNRLVREV